MFNAPWEAKAFANIVDLHKRRVFDLSEWCDTLADEIKSAQAAGDADLGDTYYRHWLTTLKTLVTAKKVSKTESLLAPTEDWRAADEHRGFGEAPVFVKGSAR
ncbi:MAG: nitrile hydratase accessory protein [Pseudomonadota bacterium]